MNRADALSLARALGDAPGIRSLYAHIADAYPLEGCGYVTMTAGAMTVVPCANSLVGPESPMVSATPEDDPRRRGFSLHAAHCRHICECLEDPAAHVVLVHGHPDGSSRPSASDLATAVRLGSRTLHMILGVSARGVDEAKIWYLGPAPSFAPAHRHGMLGLHVCARLDAHGRVHPTG